jgi:hypothetical protein
MNISNFIQLIIFKPVLLLFFPTQYITGQTAHDHLDYMIPSILETVELNVKNADGIALADINGNGKVDILTSEGSFGTVLWFEQGNSWKDWTKHFIYQIDESAEIEGNALGDFNGDGWYEAVSLDQPNGNIYLHKHSGDPRSEWQTVIIQGNRPYLQDAMITDIDGDGRSDLLYTWEGDAKGRGGINWLKLTGVNPLDADKWEDHVIVTHESAWWLAPRRIDISGNGDPTDIIFTARHMPNRNQGSKPGLFWLEPTSDVTEIWKVHTIDTTLSHPLQVDLGDLSGEGHGWDLVVASISDMIYWYEFNADWKRHVLEVPVINGQQPDRVWNIKTVSLNGGRDGILAPVIRQEARQGALIFYDFVYDRYRPIILRDIKYAHPMDDRMLLHDVTGDGKYEIFIPDSGIIQGSNSNVNLLHIMRMGKRVK